MLSFLVKFVQTDEQTVRRTTVKQYAPDLLIWGHKNLFRVNFPLATKLLTLFKKVMIVCFNDPGEDSFQIIVEKGENAGNHHLLLFPQYFLPCQNQKHYLT